MLLLLVQNPLCSRSKIVSKTVPKLDLNHFGSVEQLNSSAVKGLRSGLGSFLGFVFESVFGTCRGDEQKNSSTTA